MPTNATRGAGAPADHRADLPVAAAKLGYGRGATDMKIRARLALARNTVDGTDPLAIDEDHPLVALPYLGKIALYHHRFA